MAKQFKTLLKDMSKERLQLIEDEKQMIEGYITAAEENKELLKDFESVDKENWEG